MDPTQQPMIRGSLTTDGLATWQNLAKPGLPQPAALPARAQVLRDRYLLSGWALFHSSIPHLKSEICSVQDDMIAENSRGRHNRGAGAQ